MERISTKQLQAAIRCLNRAMGYPDLGLGEGEDGRPRPVPGAYVLDAAYGGYRLNRYVGSNGGESHITSRHTARVTLDLINAYSEGFDIGLRKGSSDAVTVFAMAEQTREGQAA